jgi:8-oxo-dGTP diphosphatase
LSPRRTVRAAGGVVWRGHDVVEVLLVHRPRYDDWSLPKGKCDPGETDEDAAHREVLEETGLDCELGVELVTSRYVDGRGRPKVVRYWAMTVRSGAFETNDEVDEVRWLTLDSAMATLTYDRDHPVIQSFSTTLRGHGADT